MSQGTLWVLDGAGGALHRLPPRAGEVPQDPSFSPDGQWLAFLETQTDPSHGSSASLWMAHADGSSPHEVAGLSGVAVVGWSPHADMLAVVAGPASTQIPCDAPTTVRLVSPDGTARRLVSARGVAGATWSPDGTEIAVSTNNADRPENTTLASYPLSGGPRTVWLSNLNGTPAGIIQPAGWWPVWGIGFWAFGGGMVHNNDQTPLDVVASPGARPQPLGDTLSNGTTVAFAAASSGSLAIVNALAGSDAGRVYWQAKQVQVCDPKPPACRSLPAPTSTVTVDPSWSPGGTTLAFAEAPSIASSARFDQGTVAAWYSAHQLWLYDPGSRTLRKVAGAQGATVPHWSGDGKSLLYVAQDGLWLLPNLTTSPVEIASPLFPTDNWPTYYAQIDWSGQFAWSSVGSSE